MASTGGFLLDGPGDSRSDVDSTDAGSPNRNLCNIWALLHKCDAKELGDGTMEWSSRLMAFLKA